MTVPIASSQAAVYELAYREGVRALDAQGMSMEAVRTRAGLLLSAAAIATSFLGGAALTDGSSAWSWAATAAFVLLGTGVGIVLWPRRTYEGFMRPSSLVSGYGDQNLLELQLVHRDLAVHLERSFLRNLGHLQRLVTTFRICSVLLLIEIVCWVVDLISKG